MIRVCLVRAADRLPIGNLVLPFVPRQGESVYIDGQPYSVESVRYYLPSEGEEYTVTVYLR